MGLSGIALDHSVKDIERGKIKRKIKSKRWKAKSSYSIRKRKMDFNAIVGSTIRLLHYLMDLTISI
jgi:hypothetical protein